MNFKGIYRCRNNKFVKVIEPCAFEQGGKFIDGFIGFEIGLDGVVDRISGALFWNNSGLNRAHQWDLMESAPGPDGITRSGVVWPIEKISAQKSEV